MNQRELNREVSNKTGESMATISHLGFIPLTPIPYERESQTLDWDDHEADHSVALMPPPKRYRQ